MEWLARGMSWRFAVKAGQGEAKWMWRWCWALDGVSDDYDHNAGRKFAS